MHAVFSALWLWADALLATTAIQLGFHTSCLSLFPPSDRAAAQRLHETRLHVHYPPTGGWTNLTWAVNGTGAPGIFNSSHSSNEQYGTYNWCCMPHVRAEEYVRPGDEYTLLYVEAVQRHHKRTPYASNTLPREDVAWDCAEEGPYAHARASSFKSTPIYWQSMSGTANPFEQTVGSGFANSTCRFPSITTGGLDDARQHGEDFGSVYAGLLKFLPLGSDREAYSFRVTNNAITSATLGAFVKGLYPTQKEYAAWVQPASFDSLEPSFPCPAAKRMRAEIDQEEPWREHLTASNAVMARFDAVTGLGPADKAWHASYDPAYDNLSAKQCHGLSLPCSINDTKLCVTQADADTIYRLGNWEYAYAYRASPRSTAYSSLKMGAWFRELVANFQTTAAGKSAVKYRHNFAHDGSMAAILGLLQFADPMWPGTGAEVVFELWTRGGQAEQNGGDSKSGQPTEPGESRIQNMIEARRQDEPSQAESGRAQTGPFVRVLWSGQPLVTNTQLGRLDMVPLSALTEYLEHTIPADLISACAA